MPSSKSQSSKSTRENAGAPRRAQTREAGIAQRANEFGTKANGRSFGAPVSGAQVLYYEAACKKLRKSKTLAQFLGFKSGDAAKRALKPVAQGTTSSSALPAATKDAFRKISVALDGLHAADGKVNKTWPRKHAIVLHALLSERPTPTRKPKAKPAPAPTTTPPAPAAE